MCPNCKHARKRGPVRIFWQILAKIGSGNRIKPRFLKGYCRNESSAREGIDTHISYFGSDCLIVDVEMSHQPERALTRSSLPFIFFGKQLCSVEMSHQPERALTLTGSMFIHYSNNVEMSCFRRQIQWQIIEKDGKRKVIVNFERPTENGFDSARCELPDYKWTEREGYSDEEIAMFEKLLHTNAHLLYRDAEHE